MVVHLDKPIKSSFMSCEKDLEIIIEELFVKHKQYARVLKKLLIVNTKDCLDNPKYDEIVDKYSVADMIDKGYIRFKPNIELPEHEEIKSYIIITFDNFLESSNPEFRDNTISIDIICHTDYWDLGDYRLRPFKILGYLDGMLNKSKLTGIGILNFISCKSLLLSEHLSGYTLNYIAYHGSDDAISGE